MFTLILQLSEKYSSRVKSTFHSLYSTYSFTTQLRHIPNGIPLAGKLITSLYSAFICSVVFTEPTLRPSFPPFSIHKKAHAEAIHCFTFTYIPYPFKQINILLSFCRHFFVNLHKDIRIGKYLYIHS